MNQLLLSDEEWDTIRARLPDIHPVMNRINKWPLFDEIGGEPNLFSNIEKIKLLRISGPCFYDAAHFIRCAQYSFAQAIGHQKYYVEKGVSELSSTENLAAGHFYRRFYMDYIPVLLWSSMEHCANGIAVLSHIELKKGNHSFYQLQANKTKLSPKIAKAIEQFDTSAERERIWKYRNNWVHNEPPRIESIFYSPPRNPFVGQLGNIEFVLQGVEAPPDYEWDSIVSEVRQALIDTYHFLIQA